MIRLPKIAIIDGGLATELEDTHKKILSRNIGKEIYAPARLLHTDPDAIKRVHLDFLVAGADIIITSSYQASLAGFMQEGFSETESISLMRKSSALALDARSEFMNSIDGSKRIAQGKEKPLVAVSLGSVGAFRCDGSEGTGEYNDLSDSEIYNYHRERMVILDGSNSVQTDQTIDLLIFETIPTLREAKIISAVLSDNPTLFNGTPAWISFRGKEDGLVGHGETIHECVSAVAGNPRISGVGVNCTKPEFVGELLRKSKNALDTLGMQKTLFCYPNSGENWDDNNRCWIKISDKHENSFLDFLDEWIEIGASAVGGCCRTSPAIIKMIAENVANRFLEPN